MRWCSHPQLFRTHPPHNLFCFVFFLSFFQMQTLYAHVVSSDDHVPVTGDRSLTSRPKKKRIDELSMHQERNPTTVSQMMSQIRELQNKVISLSDAREFCDPESGSSSGATDVPNQASAVLSPRNLPRCDSGLPRDTLNGTGITGNVFSTTCSRRTTLYNLQHFKEFGILLSGTET